MWEVFQRMADWQKQNGNLEAKVFNYKSLASLFAVLQLPAGIDIKRGPLEVLMAIVGSWEGNWNSNATESESLQSSAQGQEIDFPSSSSDCPHIELMCTSIVPFAI